MKPSLFLLLVLFMAVNTVYSQKKPALSGYLQDAESGEKLIGANIFDLRSGNGVVSNNYGFFSLTLPSDSVELIFSYIGYTGDSLKFYLKKDTLIQVLLHNQVTLETVEITSSKTEQVVLQSQMSQITLPIEQIQATPALLGETDIFKVLQLLPGVQSGNEGQNSLYVRGGSPDQNLILLDGVPVYNASHLLGIFSIFNADAIRNVTLTKGGFPARFGGRLSSVLEISMKEGNLKEFKTQGSIGLISSKATVEGPLKKDKTSFLLSGRRTYADWVLSPIFKKSQSDFGLKLYFFDVNAKLQHILNERQRFFFSFYAGKDVFNNSFQQNDGAFEGGTNWGNLIASFRFNNQISQKLFSNFTLIFSDYNIDLLTQQQGQGLLGPASFASRYFSGIRDIGAKADFDLLPEPNQYIRFGFGVTRHIYSPGALNINLKELGVPYLDTLFGAQKFFAREFYLYGEDDIDLGALRLNAGIHASAFIMGEQQYTSLEPRVSARYLVSDGFSLKASFSTMTQYINLLTNESFTLPTDLWTPSTPRVKPQDAWQAAIGAAYNLNENVELTLEGFYKKMKNLISFKEGASFLYGLENDWQDKVVQGNGKAYGMEVLLQKKEGKTTGWLGYTLSWNYRQFDEINGGRTYPFRYDRRHDISIVINHTFSPKIVFSTNWVYGTGNAVTLNSFRYMANREVFSSEAKNDYRMSDYHRLDVSLSFVKKRPNWERKWSIGAYNAYYHRNPYFMVSDTETIYDKDGEVIREDRVYKEVSLLPVIPSVSFHFKF